jgi:hypothetical protein
VIGADYKHLLAHRYSYELHKGAPAKSMSICHRCDRPACVRPDHLFEGTQAMNTRDASDKGRMHPGERTGSSKLTERQVREIRSKYVPRRMSFAMLAKEYGVSYYAIWGIVNGKTWKHIL